MDITQIDPLIKRAVADAVLERACIELQKLLREISAALDPFPSFMGISSIQAVEIEPPGLSNSKRGCVVVCADGELRELVLRMIPGPFDMGGVDQIEEMAELDAAPGEFVAYAHAAVLQLLDILEQRQNGS